MYKKGLACCVISALDFGQIFRRFSIQEEAKPVFVGKLSRERERDQNSIFPSRLTLLFYRTVQFSSLSFPPGGEGRRKEEEMARERQLFSLKSGNAKVGNGGEKLEWGHTQFFGS